MNRKRGYIKTVVAASLVIACFALAMLWPDWQNELQAKNGPPGIYGPPDNRPPDNRPPDNRPPDNRPPDNRPPDNRPPNK